MAKKILTIVEKLPQFLKATMVSRALKALNEREGTDFFHEEIIHTGHHKINEFFYKNIDQPNAATQLDINEEQRGNVTGRLLSVLEEEITARKPDLVIVYDDSVATMTGALAAVQKKVPVAHVQAGLRSFNRQMPEEINRVLSDQVATWLFCPTSTALRNLENEGLTKGAYHIGDVTYDATLAFLDRAKASDVMERLGLKDKEFYLAAIYSPENTGSPERLRNLVRAFSELARKKPVIWPLPNRLRDKLLWFSGSPGLRLTEPLDYLAMSRLEMGASVILTDFGDIQKDAYHHRTPCVTLRDETEWIETVEAGWNHLAGANVEPIVRLAQNAGPGLNISEYGRGDAAMKLAKILREDL